MFLSAHHYVIICNYSAKKARFCGSPLFFTAGSAEHTGLRKARLSSIDFRLYVFLIVYDESPRVYMEKG